MITAFDELFSSLTTPKPAPHLGLRAEGVNRASVCAHPNTSGRAAGRQKSRGDLTRPYRPGCRIEGRLITLIFWSLQLFDLINHSRLASIIVFQNV